MAGLSDETLMAYADGMLDPADRAALEATIQQCPEYQQKIAKFRATLNVRQAFADERDLGRLATLAARIRRGEGWSGTVGAL